MYKRQVQYWSYLDIWLPNDTPLSTTNDTTERIETIIRKVVGDYEQSHPGNKFRPDVYKRQITALGLRTSDDERDASPTVSHSRPQHGL